MHCLGFVLVFAIFYRCRSFSNAGLEVYLPWLVRCPFPYYFKFSFMSPTSENSPNISSSYSCCFLGQHQWHGHVLIKFSMTQQPLAGACCLSKLAKLGKSRKLQGFTQFHLFHLSTLKYIASGLHVFVEYGAFQGSATPVLGLPSSPGNATPSTLNGNCLRPTKMSYS